MLQNRFHTPTQIAIFKLMDIQNKQNISIPEAEKLQQKMAKRVITQGELNNIRYVAGTDVAYSKNKGKLIAVVVVLDIRTMERVEEVVVEDEERFPYIPGLFSFREMPSFNTSTKL